jgi:hypothetical protein
MEKWVVAAAIWTMCAMCAVLFIRGATSHAPRSARKPGRNARSGNVRGYEANDA